MVDQYESAIEPQGRFGVVFERDDDTAYFYLLDVAADEPEIIESPGLPAVTSLPDDARVHLRWHPSGLCAGAFVEDELVAVFDLSITVPHARSPTLGDQRLFG